jgi:hypothetical protein
MNRFWNTPVPRVKDFAVTTKGFPEKGYAVTLVASKI